VVPICRALLFSIILEETIQVAHAAFSTGNRSPNFGTVLKTYGYAIVIISYSIRIGQPIFTILFRFNRAPLILSLFIDKIASYPFEQFMKIFQVM
jgi:hypothetical protein